MLFCHLSRKIVEDLAFYNSHAGSEQSLPSEAFVHVMVLFWTRDLKTGSRSVQSVGWVWLPVSHSDNTRVTMDVKVGL